MSDAPAVRTEDLRVDYGEHVAVHDLNLSIPKGEIFGLVGPNGAGKTSSFRVLATLMDPTYGEVYLQGVDIAEYPEKAREHLGYMPDLAPVPSDLKVWEFLDLFAAAHGLKRGPRREKIEVCLGEVNLQESRNAFCRNLSRGMKQRLCLAKTLLHNPSVLLLDEPASGMDPVSRASLRKTLRSLADEGATIIVSSHILTELSDMCTSVGIMSRGRLVDSGRISDVVARLSNGDRVIAVTLLDEGENAAKARAILDTAAGVSELHRRGQGFRFHFGGDGAAQAGLLARLVAEGCRVRSFVEHETSIEEVILQLDEQHRNDGKAITD